MSVAQNSLQQLVESLGEAVLCGRASHKPSDSLSAGSCEADFISLSSSGCGGSGGGAGNGNVPVLSPAD